MVSNCYLERRRATACKYNVVRPARSRSEREVRTAGAVIGPPPHPVSPALPTGALASFPDPLMEGRSHDLAGSHNPRLHFLGPGAPHRCRGGSDRRRRGVVFAGASKAHLNLARSPQLTGVRWAPGHSVLVRVGRCLPKPGPHPGGPGYRPRRCSWSRLAFRPEHRPVAAFPSALHGLAVQRDRPPRTR